MQVFHERYQKHAHQLDDRLNCCWMCECVDDWDACPLMDSGPVKGAFLPLTQPLLALLGRQYFTPKNDRAKTGALWHTARG